MNSLYCVVISVIFCNRGIENLRIVDDDNWSSVVEQLNSSTHIRTRKSFQFYSNCFDFYKLHWFATGTNCTSYQQHCPKICQHFLQWRCLERVDTWGEYAYFANFHWYQRYFSLFFRDQCSTQSLTRTVATGRVPNETWPTIWPPHCSPTPTTRSEMESLLLKLLLFMGFFFFLCLPPPSLSLSFCLSLMLRVLERPGSIVSLYRGFLFH